MLFRIHDVGGQSSERRKWLTLFDCVSAVIFFVDLASFDRNDDVICGGLQCQEDEDSLEMEPKNSLKESLKLFKNIMASKIFIDATLILFLNKTDIFRVRPM